MCFRFFGLEGHEGALSSWVLFGCFSVRRRIPRVVMMVLPVAFVLDSAAVN